jgi:virulence-associated protein VagC
MTINALPGMQSVRDPTKVFFGAGGIRKLQVYRHGLRRVYSPLVERSTDIPARHAIEASVCAQT